MARTAVLVGLGRPSLSGSDDAVSASLGRRRPHHVWLDKTLIGRCHRHVTISAWTPAMVVDAADPAAEGDRTAAVLLFRSLADPARLAILRHLSLGEHRVVDLTSHLGLAQSTVSAHIACLRDCGLLASRAQGRSTLYSLAAASELMGLLAAAERLLDATGDAVVLCPTSGLDLGASATRDRSSR